jgi:ankyrin repeat protein
MTIPSINFSTIETVENSVPLQKTSIIETVTSFELPSLFRESTVPLSPKESPCTIFDSVSKAGKRQAIRLSFHRDVLRAKIPEDEDKMEDSTTDISTYTDTDDGISTVTSSEKKLLKKATMDCIKAKCTSVEQKLFFAVQMNGDNGYVLLNHLLKEKEVIQRLEKMVDRSKNNCTLMHAAAQYGTIKCMTILFEHGFTNLDVKDKLGSTPLHYACSSGQADSVMFLLSTGLVNVNSKDSYGAFPLLIALRTGRLHLIRLLIIYEADIHLKNEQGNSCLHWFCQHGIESNPGEELDRLEFLINDCKMSVTRLNRMSEHCLYSAIGKHNILRYLCEQSSFAELGKMLGHTNSDGKTVLHVCAEKGSVTSFLIISKVYMNKYWEENKESSAHRRQLAAYFIQKLNEKCTRQEQTMLHSAVQFGNYDFTQMLLECLEVRLDIKDSQGNTALDLAKKNMEEIRHLFNRGNMLLACSSATSNEIIDGQKSPRNHPLLSSGTILNDTQLIQQVVQLLEKRDCTKKRKNSFLSKLLIKF